MNFTTEYIIEVWDKEHETFDHLRFKLNEKGKMFLFMDTYPEGIQFYEFRKIKTRKQLIECADYIFNQWSERYHRVVRN